MINRSLSLSAISFLTISFVAFSGQAHAGAPRGVAPSTESLPALTAIAGSGMMNNHAYEYLEELSDNIGGRVTGTAQAQQAISWGVEQMKTIGLENVHIEKWQLFRGWKRVSASAQLTSPISRSLTVTSMGWVASTPAHGVEAVVVPVNAYRLKQELAENSANWAGKILLLVAKGEAPPSGDPIQRFAAFGDFIKQTVSAHAAAVILRQGGWEAAGMNLTHTGVLNFATYYDIPVVSMTAEDRSQLERFLDQKRAVHMKLQVHNEATQDPVESGNVVGEIRGTQNPEQVVVVGGHLDSWDLAQGSTDDGAGVAVTLGAAEAIMASGQRPKRTIRFVLFTGEEQGLLGSFAYVKAHHDDMPHHLAAIVLDNGQGPVVKLNLGGRNELIPEFEQFTESLRAFGKIDVNDKINFDTDCGPFTLAGLPGINLEQDSPQYKFTHHSEADTLDKVEPDLLIRNATVMAVTAFWIADRGARIAAAWSREKTAQMLVDKKQDSGLKAAGLWTFDDISVKQ
jgi:carboxypeptidase Q